MEQRVVMLTGAASGIGRHMARSLVRAGFRVVALDVDSTGLERLSKENSWESNPSVLLRRLDVRDAEGWRKMVDLAVDRFGHLDVLLNIAGFLKPGWVHEVEPSALDLHLDVNVKGVMYGTRAAAIRMIRQRSGHILNVASIAGLSHVPGLSAYCASKHAVRGFSLSVAHELSDHGVAVTVLCPDAVETPMLTLQENHPEAAMTFGGRRPLTLEEVENAIYRALERRPLEVVLDVPLTGRAVGAKLANLFPQLTALTARRIMQAGRAAQERRKRAS